ncbi:MAG TPA: DUF222 domain-containing protein [Streptosporangiaceae bacterium]
MPLDRENLDAGYPPDPLGSSCPPEFAGVPLAEILARAEAAAPGTAAGFAAQGPLDLALPGLALVSFCDEATGEDGRCRGACDDELIGVLRAWQRIEAWSAARRLAVTAELIRRRPAPGCSPEGPAGIPERWGKFCADELGAATANSARASDKKLTLAHDLAARLPGTARALLEGAISEDKAQLIAEATRALDPGGAAAVEALVLPGIETRTPGQIRAALARALTKVDPGAARRRREQAEQDARVELWREDAGTAALCGRDLPPADALAADQRITAHARGLRAAGLDGTMDQLRARAFLDLALGVDSRPIDQGGGKDAAPARGTSANVNLTVPAATASGREDRPGEAAGFGAVDPELARQLVRNAAADPRSTWCVTVTDQNGRAIGHGCARPVRQRAGRVHPGFVLERDHGPPGKGGPPGGADRWRLRLSSGQEFTVDIRPVPVTSCDHRDESPGYRAGARLRHLVEVRDGECTWPACRRPARRCDFDHAVPWDQGGRTCACNTGPICRRHHQAKQSPGWRLEQHRPGDHTWITPSGRSYVSTPATYPV